MSQKWIKELLATDLGYELNISIKILGELWFELTKKINEMNKYLQKQAETQGALEMVYRSVPGIGATSSRELANELGDMQHFTRVVNPNIQQAI